MLGLATPRAPRTSSLQPREGAGDWVGHVEQLPVEVEVMKSVVERLRSTQDRKNAATAVVEEMSGQRSRPHQSMLRIFNIHVITHRLNRHRDRLVRTFAEAFHIIIYALFAVGFGFHVGAPVTRKEISEGFCVTCALGMPNLCPCALSWFLPHTLP